MSIQPPEEAPKGMGAIIQHIYDQLNRLAGGSVAGESVAETSLTSGGGGGGGSLVDGAVLDGLETTVQGIPPPNKLLLRHIAIEEFDVVRVFMDAQTAPQSDFAVFLRRIDRDTRSVLGTTPVVLSSGANSADVTLNQAIDAGTILEIVTDSQAGQWTDTIAGLTINLDIA
jgi:hypothetical protein